MCEVPSHTGGALFNIDVKTAVAVCGGGRSSSGPRDGPACEGRPPIEMGFRGAAAPSPWAEDTGPARARDVSLP